MSLDITALLCPITSELFKSAQKVNCTNNHSFELEFVQEFFGELLAGNECANPGPCPLCRERVTSYSFNGDLQKIVDSCSEIIVKSHPANNWINLKTGKRIELPELQIACISTSTIQDISKRVLRELSPIVKNPLTLEKNIRIIACGRQLHNDEKVFDVGARTHFWYVTR